MLEDKIEKPTEEEESVLEKPLDVSDPETIRKVKEAIADEVIADAGISPEQSDAFKKMLEEATMPVVLENKNFKLGDNELDIRSLNQKNIFQMLFRTQALQAVYLKNVNNTLIDLLRLVMILLDKLGVPDIVAATDDIIEKIKAQNEKKEHKDN